MKRIVVAPLILLAVSATFEGCSEPSYTPPADQIPTIPAGRASANAVDKGGVVAPP